jgi:hypothetical protein
MKKSDSKEIIVRYSIAFAIALITFIAGIFLGLSLAKKDVFIVGINENNLQANLFELETTIKFIENDICDDKLIKDFGIDLDRVGQELEALQNKLFVSKDEYQFLKNYYYSLEINHYLLLKKAEQLCNKTFIFIFYFYRPIEECPKCYNEGLYLTVLKQKYKDLVQIYNFNLDDYNKSILLKKMLIKYNINPNEEAPILIINGKKYHYLSKEELENLVKKIISNSLNKEIINKNNKNAIENINNSVNNSIINKTN